MDHLALYTAVLQTYCKYTSAKIRPPRIEKRKTTADFSGEGGRWRRMEVEKERGGERERWRTRELERAGGGEEGR